MRGSAVLGATIAVGLLGSPTMALAQESPDPTSRSAVASGFTLPFEYMLPAGWAPSLVFEHPSLVILTTADPLWRYGDLQHGGLPGVLVADVTSGWIHPCPRSDSRAQVGGGPGDFLTDMQAMAGLDFEDWSMAKLDGRPAITATSLSRGRCGTSDVHLEGAPSFQDYIDLGIVSHLTVADVDGRTILVQAWAASASNLDEWLPTAKEFTDSIHFVETGE